VLDGYPAPPLPEGGGHRGDTATPPPIFGPCLLWPNGWMEKDATWYEGRGRAMRHCVRRGLPTRKGQVQQPPSFGPMSIVATVAHLSCCSAHVCNLLHQILRLLTVTVSFDVKRRSRTLFPVLRKSEVVFNSQTVVNRSI